MKWVNKSNQLNYVLYGGDIEKDTSSKNLYKKFIQAR